MEQVYENEGGQWLLQIGFARFSGMDEITYLHFNEDGMFCAGSYTNLADAATDYTTAYQTARYDLASTYGEPADESFCAPDGTVLSSLDAAAACNGSGESRFSIVTADGIRTGTAAGATVWSGSMKPRAAAFGNC
jgi:hypothetical protein